MKEFACGDLIPGCSARFTAPTNEGILEQVAHHARHDHGLVSVPDDLVANVLSHIRAA